MVGMAARAAVAVAGLAAMGAVLVIGGAATAAKVPGPAVLTVGAEVVGLAGLAAGGGGGAIAAAVFDAVFPAAAVPPWVKKAGLKKGMLFMFANGAWSGTMAICVLFVIVVFEDSSCVRVPRCEWYEIKKRAEAHREKFIPPRQSSAVQPSH